MNSVSSKTGVKWWISLAAFTVLLTSQGGVPRQSIAAGKEPGRSISSFAIVGPQQVNEGKSIQFSVQAISNSGKEINVSGNVVWSVTPGGFAQIDQTGLLSALEVEQNEIITVRAEYETRAEVYAATQTVTIINTTNATGGSHANRFATYDGPSTCLKCHTAQGYEVHNSIHYQWKGDASEAVGLTDAKAGKMSGINDFCIYPDINWLGKLTTINGTQVDGGCAKCHIGMGAKPAETASEAELQNIDCLVCHSETYKRKLELIDGNYRFVPDTANMTVSLMEAATNISEPAKGICLNCHTKAGGGDNFKRGDIEEAHRNPTRDFDVHMASKANGGAGLNCTDCHEPTNHQIPGRGSDMRAREGSIPVNCTKCHTDQPHDNAALNTHTARVNCTVCHIPTFAKVAATDMDRDWSVSGDLVAATGLYEPHHVKGKDVIPEYRFFNGTSYFYQFGDPAMPGKNGRIIMSEPLGTIADTGAKIHAFKHHLASQPIDPVTQRLLPLKIGKFFETGTILDAIRLGTTAVGWAYTSHEFAETERWMGLYHEVAPKGKALSCNSCHNGGTRMDFDALGYAPNASYNNKPLCASCHGDKSREWKGLELFTRVHAKHVTDKKLDCSVCHTFSKAVAGN